MTFDPPLLYTPKVSVALSSLDTLGGTNTRVSSWAEDVTCHGFTVHVSSWHDSVVYSAKVSWIASCKCPAIKHDTCSVGQWPNDPITINSAKTIRVDFPEPFPPTARPSAIVALSGCDIETGVNVRVSLEVQTVEQDHLTFLVSSWADSKTWNVNVMYIAADVGRLPEGVAIGCSSVIPHLAGVQEKSVEVHRRGLHGSRVLPLLTMLVANWGTNLRVATKASAPSHEGFQLSAESWSDTFIHGVGLNWFATPESFETPPPMEQGEYPVANVTTTDVEAILDKDVGRVRTLLAPTCYFSSSGSSCPGIEQVIKEFLAARGVKPGHDTVTITMFNDARPEKVCNSPIQCKIVQSM